MCNSTRQSNIQSNNLDEFDDSLDLKRKVPKSNPINPINLINQINPQLTEILHKNKKDEEDDEDEKERLRWLELEELKHRITEIETRAYTQELDQYHMGYQQSYIS
jgi:hypothetical protein